MLKTRIISRIQYIHWPWHTHTLGVCECMSDFEILIQFFMYLYVLLFELMYCIFNWCSLQILQIWIRKWKWIFETILININSYNLYSFIFICYTFNSHGCLYLLFVENDLNEVTNNLLPANLTWQSIISKCVPIKQILPR